MPLAEFPPAAGKTGRRDDIRPMVGIILAAWLLLVSLSFCWNLHNARQERMQIALQSSRTLFSQIVLTREWNARHGGVYVPVDGQTRPNPYLETPRRDIAVDGHLQLTKINPAFMTRQLSELAEEKEGIRFHITSLKPIRPLNAPDAWEKQALLSFEKGEKERGEYLTGNNSEPRFLYMAPLVTETACLGCHAKQGYSLGDIRGGIRITLPFDGRIPLRPLLEAHLVLGLSGILIILLFGRRLRSAHEELRHRSIYDVLTGIPNRRFFEERLSQEFNRSRREALPLTLIICDMDFFKQFNDTYGHGEGDRCLQKIAGLIQSTLKRPSDFCARYGGEEFVILLPNTARSGGLLFADILRNRVQEQNIPHRCSSVAPLVTVSLGLATMEMNEPISAEELIRRADTALYQAKGGGRNRVRCWQPSDGDAPVPITERHL